MRLQVLHAEVGLGLVFVRPWAAHEDFVAVHCLLQVCAEFFEQIVESTGDAGVFARLSDLFSFNHLLEQRIEQLFPVLLAQCGRQEVEFFDAGFLESGLGEQALGVQFDPLAVDVKEPQRWLGVVLGQR